MSQEFRDIMSEVPTCVAIVMCSDKDGLVGCTISSLISVSVELNDEKVLFALKKGSRVGSIIGEKKVFYLSVLSESQKDIARFAGGVLKGVELSSYLQENITSRTHQDLYFRESRIEFSLVLDQVIDVISSNLFLCKVQTARVCGDSHRKPLIYFRRSYGKLEEA